MSFLYLITIVVILAILVGVTILMKYFHHQLITNIVFCSLIVICYGFVILIAYLQNGPNDWNFTNTLPVANISPFMFAASPIFFILPKKIRKYYATLIALLVVGMILSPILSCVYNFSISYKFHPSFLLNYAAHIALALWGIYLVLSKQCDLEIKSCLIAGAIIVSVAITMIILNVIFDQSFFGLSLNGKHNIYNMVLVDNSYLSALIYFAGLGAVLVSSYFLQKLILFLFKKSMKKD